MINQLFPILYKNERFMVNPSSMYNSSRKFHELINANANDYQTKHLRVLYDSISVRNLSNFLKICQNQQTDVQNSELKEICLIAKLFKADQVYNTGLSFIRSNIDPNFFIPDNQFDETSGNQYLILESNEEPRPVHHKMNFNELEFDDELESKPPEFNYPKDDTNNQRRNQGQTFHSTIYQITDDIPLLKLPRFYLSQHNNILYMAKVKRNNIYIGKGSDLHISENKIQDSAKITRRDEGYNIVNTDDQEFRISYVKTRDSYSLNVSFVSNGIRQVWKPKEVYSLEEFNGERHHTAMMSKHNIILQNSKNKPVCIIRKMTNKYIEVECHPDINPVIVFAIGLSQIVGPITL